jgi:hypothetical protein
MRFRTLLAIGLVVGLVGVVAGLVIASLGDSDETDAVGLVVAGGAIAVLLVLLGFVAGWFGRERDDVVVVAIGAAIAVAVALAIASVLGGQISIVVIVLAGAVAFIGSALGTGAWWIGDVICDGRDLPTARRLTAPAYVEDVPGYPLWTTDAGPAIRATLDALASQLGSAEAVHARAVGIVVGLPRDTPAVVLLAGDRLAVQPVTINGAVDGEPTVFRRGDIDEVSMRSVDADGTTSEIHPYRDIITLHTVDGSRIRLRLPYGRRGVGSGAGGPEVIRAWLTARPTVDR